MNDRLIERLRKLEERTSPRLLVSVLKGELLTAWLEVEMRTTERDQWKDNAEIYRKACTLPEVRNDAFSKVVALIEDIKIERYGKPLQAALHLCNDLADELERERLPQDGVTK